MNYYDGNGNSATEINHSHPRNTMSSGYDKVTGAVKIPLSGDAINATHHPTNSNGQTISRGVYRPAIKKMNRYDETQAYPSINY